MFVQNASYIEGISFHLFASLEIRNYLAQGSIKSPADKWPENVSNT